MVYEVKLRGTATNDYGIKSGVNSTKLVYASDEAEASQVAKKRFEADYRRDFNPKSLEIDVAEVRWTSISDDTEEEQRAFCKKYGYVTA